MSASAKRNVRIRYEAVVNLECMPILEELNSFKDAATGCGPTSADEDVRSKESPVAGAQLENMG
jgi:hypothetical protein